MNEASSSPEAPPEEEVKKTRARNTPHRSKEADRLPINFLWAEHAQKWMAIALAVLSLAGASAFSYYTLKLSKEDMKVIVLDGSDTFHVGPLESMHPRSPVFTRTALLAAQAHYQRSPAGLDLAELGRDIYEGPAFKKLEEDYKQQRADIEVRNIHQKPEIDQIRALRETPEGVRIIEVSGSLVRAGSFQGLSISESEKFAILFALVRNPRAGDRAAFPFVVMDFAYAEVR